MRAGLGGAAGADGVTPAAAAAASAGGKSWRFCGGEVMRTECSWHLWAGRGWGGRGGNGVEIAR